MNKIKPVYQLKMSNGSWIDQERESYEYNVKNGHEIRIVYPVAAYEALQKQNNALKLMCESKTSQLEIAGKEVAQLRSLDADNKGLKECNAILTEENAALQAENKNLKNQVHSLNFDNAGLSTGIMDWQRLYKNAKAEAEAQAKRITELEAAVLANHEHHQEHDDHGGYEFSEMFDRNMAALSVKKEKYCLGYTHTKCESCQHFKNWEKLNDMPEAERLNRQKGMCRINSDKCRMTKMGEYAAPTPPSPSPAAHPPNSNTISS